MNANKQNPRVKWAVVTGATTGIGYEISKLLAADGHPLLLTARNGELLADRQKELTDQYGVRAEIFPADLALPDVPRKLADYARDLGIKVNILINNAGFGMVGDFRDIPLETEIRMIHLNVTALTVLTGLFLDDMLREGDGRILNVSSTAAFQPGPGMAVYYATKAYVYSFSEALARELKGTGVTVTTLCPGPVATNFQESAGVQQTHLVFLKNMSAAAVARQGYRALKKGSTLVIPGVLNKMMVQMLRVSPRRLILNIIRLLHKRRRLEA